jgi:hypothetical protein
MLNFSSAAGDVGFVPEADSCTAASVTTAVARKIAGPNAPVIGLVHSTFRRSARKRLLKPSSAVHWQCRSGDEIRGRTAQEHDGTGDIVSLTPSARRGAR